MTDAASVVRGSIEFRMQDGVKIQADTFGRQGDEPVLLAHGGGQTRHSWGNTASRLARDGRYCVCYDHRGHGDSDWSPDGIYNLGRFAEDQQQIADQLHSKPVVVGASLGGISAMLSQGEANRQLYRAIVLVDITPTMNEAGALNVITFMRERMEEGFADLQEAAKTIAEYTGRPLRKDTSGLAKNLRLDDDGRYRWHWDPNFVQVRADRKTNPSRMSDAVKNISIPMLLVRGRMSDLVTETEVAEFLKIAPQADYVDVEHARHMVAGDRNDIFTEAVVNFIQKID